jgi:hypothetical protein
MAFLMKKAQVLILNRYSFVPYGKIFLPCALILGWGGGLGEGQNLFDKVLKRWQDQVFAFVGKRIWATEIEIFPPCSLKEAGSCLRS